MILRAATLILLAPALVSAWDPAGHMLVGQIAWELSSPHVRARVE